MYTHRDYQRPDIVFSNTGSDRGQPQVTRLDNNVMTDYLDVYVEGDVVIAGAVAASIRNRGSLLAPFRFGVREGGDEKYGRATARAIRFVSETKSASLLTSTRLASTAIATTTLREHLRLWFADPLSLAPRETSYRERNPADFLEFFAILDADAAGMGAQSIAEPGGGGTVTLQNVRIKVVQSYNPEERALPLFVPRLREIRRVIAQASTELEIYLQPKGYLRAITIMQDARPKGEVTDAINKITLRTDRRELIGPAPADWKQRVRAQEFSSGGDVFSGPNGAYLHFDFVRNGRLSQMHNPFEDPGLRLIVDGQPSAGQTTTEVVILLWEHERDLYEDPTSRRRVVEPSLPFQV